MWPEEDWERRTPHIELDHGDVVALSRAILDRDDVVHHELLTGGKCNTNVRLRYGDGEQVVLRVYERDRWACERDRVIADLAAPTVPVPAVPGVLGDADALPERLQRTLDGKPVAVFEWIDGDSPIDILERATAQQALDLARELGSTLARISGLSRFEDHGLLDERLDYRRRFSSHQASFVDFVDWSLEEGRTGERLGAELSAKLRCYAHDNARRLHVLEGECGLVHGDYKLSNILVRRESDSFRVCAVLDWEFAMAGSPLFDMAIMLRHARRWPQGFAEGFADGFVDEGGFLPPDWRQLSELLDVMNWCGFLNASGHRRRLFEAVRQKVRAL